MRTARFVLASISILALASCASVRAIKIQPGKGGVIGVNPGFSSVNDPETREKAMKEMERNCGMGKVKIVEEGYVKVGESITTSAEKQKNNESTWFGPKKKTTKVESTHSSDVNQWQIIYQCIE